MHATKHPSPRSTRESRFAFDPDWGPAGNPTRRYVSLLRLDGRGPRRVCRAPGWRPENRCKNQHPVADYGTVERALIVAEIFPKVGLLPQGVSADPQSLMARGQGSMMLAVPALNDPSQFELSPPGDTNRSRRQAQYSRRQDAGRIPEFPRRSASVASSRLMGSEIAQSP